MSTLKFDELNLSKELQKAITEMGFEESTPIQSLTIPILLKGSDLIGQAQTGTGKTAAFGIPIIEKVDSHSKEIQAVVLCPTRELAIQVSEELLMLLKYKKNLRVLPIYGGQPIDRQLRALRKGIQIIIATPGRLIDHIERKTVNLENAKIIVLDEADEMLDMGFREPIELILKKAPKDRQTIFFSATMPKQILELTKKYLKHPEHVNVVHKELTVPDIKQSYFEVKQSQKLEVLTRLIDMHNPKLTLVFCNTKRGVDDLVSHLQARGYLADALHGDLKQNQRDKVMGKFRTGKMDILVATDVAARGIDVDDIDAVINYDMPQDEEYYVHRIGRTARAGRTGEAFTFVTGKDFSKIMDIERYTKSKIVKKQIPRPEDVAEIRTSSLVQQIRDSIGEGEGLKQYEDIIQNLINEDFTSMEVASGLLKIIMERELKDEAAMNSDAGTMDNREYKREKGRDDNSGRKRDKKAKRKPGHDEFRRSDSKGVKSSGDMVRLFINAGRKQNVKAGDIVGAFAGETGMPGDVIGNIDIYDKFSFIEVPEKYVDKVIDVMDNNQIKGKRIAVEVANERKG
jgi:ATP-dependent RNA helicase DeaD